jgi:hypothetical protein
MRLLAPQEMPGVIQGTLCRQSRVTTLLAAVAMLSMLIGIPAFLAWNADLPKWIGVVVFGWGLLIAYWLVRWLGGNVVKSWLQSNWLLRIAPDGLWINIRSFLNHEFPPGRTVIHLPYDEIACVREHVTKRAERTSDGNAEWSERYLDIELSNSVPEELRTELAEELRRQVKRSHFGGLAESRTRHGNSNVTVPSSNAIRLAWRSRFDWVTPPLRRALRELQGRVAVCEPSRDDFSNWKSMGDGQIDRLTLQLVESGDKMGAIKLLTERRGYTATDARLFVDEMISAL